MGSIRKKGSRYYIRFVNAYGKQVEKSAGTDKQTALRLLSESERKSFLVRDGVMQEADNKLLIKSLFGKFLEYMELSRRPSHVENTRRYLKAVQDFFGKFATVEHLTPTRFEAFLQAGQRASLPYQVDHASSKPWSTRTANFTLTMVKTALNWGIDRGAILSNPLEKFKKLKGEQVKERRAMSEEEIQFLLANATGQDKEIFLFALSTGCRMGEILSLEWQDVDLFSGQVMIQASKAKGKRSRLIPITGELLEILRGRPGKPEALVFESPKNPGKPLCISALRKRFKKNLTKAGINPRGLDLHALRVSFITVCARKGISPATVANMVGHTDVSLTLNIYTKIEQADARKAAETIGTIFEAKEKKETSSREAEQA